MQLREKLPKALRDSRAVEVLERSLASNRLGHGILLHGQNMDSLEQIVRAISSHLLKTERDPYQHTDSFTLRPSVKARKKPVGDSHQSNTMRQFVNNNQKNYGVC